MHGFFVLDSSTDSTFLLNSPDYLDIQFIIQFYFLQSNVKQKCLSRIINNNLQNFDPEFGGIVEIAYCKKEHINYYHSSFKSFTFKKQYLQIKNGKK